MAKSHYLEKDRLANVIAAIQIMGVSDQTTGTLNRWVAELEASEELTSEQLDHAPVKYAERKKWATVFEQHPEFFKTYTQHGEQHVLLRWRYAQSFNANLTKEANAKPEGDTPDSDDADEAKNTAGPPLSAEQVQVLVKIAMELHTKEATADIKPDRLSPIVMVAVGATLGTIVGGGVVMLFAGMQMTHMIRIFN
jgi:hypothetical protein